MYKYRIMIIDDEIMKRIGYLSDFLTNEPLRNHKGLSDEQKSMYIKKVKIEFEIIYPQGHEVLDEFIRTNRVDAYFLDVVYDKIQQWTLGGILASIRTYNKTAPIFMYSVDWDKKPILETVTSEFRNHFPGKTATYFYNLNQINRIVINFREAINDAQIISVYRERKYIKDMIEIANNRTTKEPYSDEENIAILHISDIQYGDKNTTKYKINLWNEVAGVCNKLQEDKEISGIDLLAITGDITMQGKCDEMEKANKDLKCLFEKLWPDEYKSGEYKERILLVPGNHDFDLNFCTLDYLFSQNISDKTERKIDFEKAAESLKSENREKYNNYHTMGLTAYKDFAYEITGNPIFYQRKNLNFIEDRFSSWGIRFICLNTCSGIHANKTNGVEIDEGEVTKIIQEGNEKNYYTVVLSHHTPLIEKELDDESKKKFEVISDSIIRTCKAKVWLGGHHHIHASKRKSNSLQSCIVYESATIRLEEEWKNDETYVKEIEFGKIKSHRGFQIILLKKCDNVYKPTIIEYVFDEKGIAHKVKNSN